MPVFNRAKLAADAARGIANPRSDPGRTPSADAIQMRFKQLAGAPVKWEELVRVSLLPFEQRTMWLSALRREDARDDLSDHVVRLALGRVGAELGASTISSDQYGRTRETLIADDRARYGDEGAMAKLLPTTGQVTHYCKTWASALAVAGMSPPAAASPKPVARPPAGLPLPEAMALYAGLNGAWASRPVLRDFATASRFALPDLKGADWDACIAKGYRLLIDQGVRAPAPTRAKPRGRGKRLTYLYPTGGVPGAPRPSGTPLDKATLQALKRELAILGLRVWLASLDTTESPSQDRYRQWRSGTPFMAPSQFAALGGFTQLKHAALADNTRARQDHGELVPPAELARFDEALAQLARPNIPKPVPFADALAAVLAGPHDSRQPPKQ